MSDVTVGRIVLGVLVIDTVGLAIVILGGWIHDLRQRRRWRRYYESTRRELEFEKIERFANRES